MRNNFNILTLIRMSDSDHDENNLPKKLPIYLGNQQNETRVFELNEYKNGQEINPTQKT